METTVSQLFCVLRVPTLLKTIKPQLALNGLISIGISMVTMVRNKQKMNVDMALKAFNALKPKTRERVLAILPLVLTWK